MLSMNQGLPPIEEKPTCMWEHTETPGTYKAEKYPGQSKLAKYHVYIAAKS